MQDNNQTIERDNMGNYIVTDIETGETEYIQTDYDRVPTASAFGWDLASVGPTENSDILYDLEAEISGLESEFSEFSIAEVNEGKAVLSADSLQPLFDFLPLIASHNRQTDCDHNGTDGTTDCNCGLTATDFIESATNFLDDLC